MRTLPIGFFRKLTDDLEVAIFVTDEKGTLYNMNERASSIIRLSRAAASGKLLERLFPQDVTDYLIHGRTKALATGKIQSDSKISIIMPGWGFRFFDIRIIPYRSKEEGSWVAHLFYDITVRERREMASETARLDAEAEARARRAFLARMSHEIRTPMNGIIGMTDLALQSGSQEEIAECLDVIKGAADSLLTIINDVLDFAKVESDNMELAQSPINLSELLQDTLSLLNPASNEKNIALTGEIDPELPKTVWGDPTRIRQILINLVGNAVKFTPKGKVSVHLSRGGRLVDLHEDELILLGEVMDTGIGIAPDKMKTLFTPFSQGGSDIGLKFGGSGLGLAICRTLARLMGGDIEVESSVGTGSIFRFRLRVRRARDAVEERVDQKEIAGSGDIVPSETPSPLWEGHTVLLAEDNRVNRLVGEKILSQAGLNVICCHDGQEAVRSWKTHTPDLILMDIQMPNLDGLEATKEIRKAEKKNRKQTPVPIIALTAHFLDEERMAALEAGMNGWVSKPVKPAALYAEMKKVFSPVMSGKGHGVKS